MKPANFKIQTPNQAHHRETERERDERVGVFTPGISWRGMSMEILEEQVDGFTI